MANDDDTSVFKVEGYAPGAPGVVAGVRVTKHTEEQCVLLPAPEGVPIPPGAELVRRERVDEHTFKLTTLYKPKGPSKVATPRYRSNYDAVFGAKERTLNKSLN